MRYSCLAALAVIAGLLGPAQAIAPAPTPGGAFAGYGIEIPDGWDYKPGIGDGLVRTQRGQRHYDGLETVIGADAFVSPDGAALYLVWIHAQQPSDRPGLLVRRTFDTIRQSPSAASPMARSAELVSWEEQVTDSLADGRLEWRHLSNETTTVTRTLLYLTTSRQLRQVRAECVMQTTALDKLRPQCDAILASLSIAAPVAERAPLGAVPSAGKLELSDDSSAPMLVAIDDGLDAGSQLGSSPSMYASKGEGGRVLYQGDRPSDDSSDSSNRMLLIGGGLLLAAGIYLTLKQRKQDDE